jgi:hypothetical protein
MIKLRSSQAKSPGSLRFVPTTLAEYLRNHVALDHTQVSALSDVVFTRLRPVVVQAQMIGGDETALAENRRAFERIPQFSHVTRPPMTQ